MMSRRLLSAAFFFCTLAVTAARAQSVDAKRDSSAIFAQIDSAVRAELQAGGIPGAAVAVVAHGRVVYLKGYGRTDVESGPDVTPQTLFRLASTTKMFTAAALLVLADRRAVSLTAPVSRYVSGLSPCVGRVTLGALLGHTAGIADSASEDGPHDESARTRWVRAWPCARAFLPAGRFFSYSNLGYDLAGEVLGARVGGSYATALDSLLFTPLRMSRSTVRPTVAMTYPLALGHQRAAAGTVVVRPAADDAREWPAGGVFTSAEEYARFAVALLADGLLDGARVLPSGILDSMAAPRAPELDTRPERRAFIGYGLNVRDAGGYHVLQHAGSMRGYGSVIRLVPEEGFAVILLTNRTGAVLANVMSQVTTLVTGRPAPPPLPTPTPIAFDEAERRLLAGTYGSGTGYLTLSLSNRPTGLFLQQLGSPDSSRVDRIDRDAFITDGTYFAVSRGADGRVEYLHIAGHTLRRSPADRSQSPQRRN